MAILSTKPLLDEILEQTRIFTTGATYGLIVGAFLGYHFTANHYKKQELSEINFRTASPNLGMIENFYKVKGGEYDFEK